MISKIEDIMLDFVKYKLKIILQGDYSNLPSKFELKQLNTNEHKGTNFFNKQYVKNFNLENNQIIVYEEQINYFDLYIKLLFKMLQHNTKGFINCNAQKDKKYFNMESFPIFAFNMVIKYSEEIDNYEKDPQYSSFKYIIQLIKKDFNRKENVFQKAILVALNYIHYGIYSDKILSNYMPINDKKEMLDEGFESYLRIINNSELLIFKDYIEILNNLQFFFNEHNFEEGIFLENHKEDLIKFILINDAIYDKFSKEILTIYYPACNKSYLLKELISLSYNQNKIHSHSENKIIIGNSGTGKTYKFNQYKIRNLKFHKINFSDMNFNDFILYLIEDMISLYNDLSEYHYINKKIDRKLILIDEFNRNESWKIISKYIALFDLKNGFSIYPINVNIDNRMIKKISTKFKIEELKETKEFINNEVSNRNFTEKDFFANVYDDNINIIHQLIEDIVLALKEQKEEVIIKLILTPLTNWWFIMNSVDLNTKQIDLMFNRRFNIEYIPYDIERDDYFIELKDKTLISWFKIQSSLNKIIKEHCHESKCIGYYFWNLYEEIENKRIIRFDDFKNKLVYHIYGSILNNFDNNYFHYNIKDEKNSLFFNSNSLNDLMKANTLEEMLSHNLLSEIFPSTNQNFDKKITYKEK